jgi:uncharacterized SAM-dependent methyltransferase
MDAHAADIAAQIGPVAALIELGSGTSLKTRLLLEEMESPVAYMPVDVARTPLVAAARALAARFPDIAVIPVCADFTQPIALPEELADVRRRVVYFAGSTIGNFQRPQAIEILEHMRDLAGPDGAVLVSIDLAKRPAVMERAYNDSAEQRIEMRLRSTCAQMVRLGGEQVAFGRDEELVTEYCHKYLAGEFTAMGQAAGLCPREQWTDRQWGFSVQLLEPAADCRPLEVANDVEAEARAGCRIAF